jgi:hypothetical protein
VLPKKCLNDDWRVCIGIKIVWNLSLFYLLLLYLLLSIQKKDWHKWRLIWLIKCGSHKFWFVPFLSIMANKWRNIKWSKSMVSNFHTISYNRKFLIVFCQEKKKILIDELRSDGLDHRVNWQDKTIWTFNLYWLSVNSIIAWHIHNRKSNSHWLISYIQFNFLENAKLVPPGH